jgi:NAD(P)H-hydrate epimerase
MENAARACAVAIARRFPASRRPIVLCGAGNNGGDGLALARILADWNAGVRPAVVVRGDRERYSPESRENLELLLRAGAEVVFARGEKVLEALGASADLAIDALFGVGLSREIEGEALEALGWLAGSPLPSVAIDLPSGLHADTGAWLGPVLEPDLVVTLGLPKLGLALRPLASETLVGDLGIPWSCVEEARLRAWMWTPGAAARRLPRRPLEGHKGTFGHVFVIAGSLGKTGAACLAAEGALRAGAGLVTVAVPASQQPIVAAKLTEAMTQALPERGDGCLDAAAAGELVREAARRDALVIGPGLGLAEHTVQAVVAVLAAARVPAVVDADALSAFAGRPEALRGPGARVLTPHPGEFARLLDRTMDAVLADRVGSALALARASGAVVVHKGARSVIAAPDGEVRVNPTGGPGLASGGTGDVLAGVIGALLGAGVPAFDAAALGAWLHGDAGASLGNVGVLAGEVARAIPGAWRRLAAPESESGDDLLRRFP